MTPSHTSSPAGSGQSESALNDRSSRDGQSSRTEKELFEHIHQTIVEQQLFLDPDFSREKFIKIGLINKNKVARLLRQHAGSNLNGYINRLRLEYACRLMREHPDAPIKAIAMNSGFKQIRTFFRVFFDRYGVTPTEYKAKL